MKYEFLILSYYRDFPWLRYCLRSIEKFARGFGVTVVVPRGQVRPVLDGFEEMPSIQLKQLKEDTEPEGLGQLFSQVNKCSADVFVSPDTEFVFFIDSDCLITHPLTPEMFFRDGKPVMPYNTYEHLVKHNCGSMIWQEVIKKNLGFYPKCEFLRQMPLVYPRALFPALRRFVEARHNMRFADYVFSTGKNSWPQNFCESNDLGAYAWERMHDSYYWLNLDEGNTINHPRVTQFWSHGGFDHPIDVCTSPFAGYMVGDKLPEPHSTPRKVITEVLGSF